MPRRRNKSKLFMGGGKNPAVGSQPNTGRVLPIGGGTIARQLNIFPLRKRASLRYHDVIDLGVVGITVVNYSFCANGLYDPDITGTGHQPMGFDNMMLFYQHYIVLRSRITVQFINYVDDAAAGVFGGLGITRGGSVPTTWSRLVEEGNFEFQLLGAQPSAGGFISPPQKMSCDVGKFQGVTYPADDDTLRGTASANPATLIYYNLSAHCPAGTTTRHVGAAVTIEYDALFVEPVPPSQSLKLEGTLEVAPPPPNAHAESKSVVIVPPQGANSKPVPVMWFR